MQFASSHPATATKEALGCRSFSSIRRFQQPIRIGWWQLTSNFSINISRSSAGGPEEQLPRKTKRQHIVVCIYIYINGKTDKHVHTIDHTSTICIKPTKQPGFFTFPTYIVLVVRSSCHHLP